MQRTDAACGIETTLAEVMMVEDISLQRTDAACGIETAILGLYILTYKVATN